MRKDKIYHLSPPYPELPRQHGQGTSKLEVTQLGDRSFASKMTSSMAASWLRAIVFACLFFGVLARSFPWKDSEYVIKTPEEPLQRIVTWDKHSLFINGKRIMFFSGEFHPFRLPVPSLWLDVFEKVRSMGYTGVSFYVDWALLEGKPGNFSAKGVFDLEPFFDAAAKAGVYLLARPGPYINAEVAGGGFPGWMQRVKGVARTADPSYMRATDLYTYEIGKIIAKAQITNGGPVILFQPENEYTGAAPGYKFPDADYMNAVYAQYRKAGIVIPFLSNDAGARGHNAPGQPAPVDIYGHDAYPLGFDCSNPDKWNPESLPTRWRSTHMKQSPSTPYAMPEFQGGSYDPWAGPGFAKCARLTGAPFERVFYKNAYAAGVTIFNIYMTYGGTNWGNLGQPFGYTSYDYGSPISEERLIDKEKYSEAKLQANFLVASPQYLDSEPEESFTTENYTTSTDLAVTRLHGPDSSGFFVIRHNPYNTTNSVKYKLKLPKLPFTFALPLSGQNLTLHSRDSKMLAVNYDFGGTKVAYSTAEIFTWKSYPQKKVLIVYSDVGDINEMALLTNGTATASPGVEASTNGDHLVIKWTTTAKDQVVRVNNLEIYLVDRISAYSMWVLSARTGESNKTPYSGTESSNVIIKGGYLMRSATVKGDTLSIRGDLNKTTELKIIAGAPDKLSSLSFNSKPISNFIQNSHGIVTATIELPSASFTVPDLSKLPWKSIDSLPEIKPQYSDSSWTLGTLKETYNDRHPLRTPVSLYASDYGFHYGTIIYRGTFKATGQEKKLTLHLRSGYGGAALVYLNSTFIDSKSILGHGNMDILTDISGLEAGKTYIITIVLDNMGHNENWTVGEEEAKKPIGVMDYDIQGLTKSDITWKLAGTLGAEDYLDRARGPANEGGLYVERQGFHLPSPPTNSSEWASQVGPPTKVSQPGVTFHVTSFDLNIPKGFDIPLYIMISNSSVIEKPRSRSAYRLNLYVNGWNFGKYINDMGPQTKFPIPEGIWDYRGKNWLAVSIWNLENRTMSIDEIKLVTGPVIYTGMEEVKVVESPKWAKRSEAF